MPEAVIVKPGREWRGDAVRKCRWAAHYSQKRLARKMGITQQAVAKMETGAVGIESIMKVAAACGMGLELQFAPMEKGHLGAAA